MTGDQDRVVMVTGGARGLGRSHVLHLAAAGLRVVVNDTGTELDGRGRDASLASDVAAQARDEGGTAVADTSDVSTHDGARRAVRCATETFGRLDAVVHSAGILRDRTLAKMSFEDFDEVVRVHLGATAYVTSAAWPALCAGGAGRVVLTSSAGGLFGQFGQAGYGAAKAAQIGLLQVLAQEGARDRILVNAIAPVAATRMTEPLLLPAQLERLEPLHVSRLVRFLCSASCSRTGAMLEVAAGLVAQAAVVSSGTRPLDPEATDDQLRATLDELAAAQDLSAYANSPAALERFLTPDA